MDVSALVVRKADRLTTQVGDATLLRASQMVRQFHRIGRSRSPGCRKALEHEARQTAEALCNQLCALVVTLAGDAIGDDDAERLISKRVEQFIERFIDGFSSLLEQMEGYDPQALAADCRQPATGIRAALAEARHDAKARSEPEAVDVPDLSFLSDAEARRRAVSCAMEAALCSSAGAYVAAAVFCGVALRTVLAATLEMPVQQSELVDLLRAAREQGMLGAQVVDLGAWTTSRTQLLQPEAVLNDARTVEASDARDLLRLLKTVCAALRAR